MFIACDKNKNRVRISDVLDNEKYYCPECGEELRVRQGDANAHHFAHKPNSNCVIKDGWHYDMSDWHYDWQNQFPLENQERVFAKDDEIHRADVFINNVVIEFQHSPIVESEFNDRNAFYKSFGFKVIWIFDVTDKEIEHLHDTDDGERVFSWKNPIRFLKNIDCSDPNLDVYLQIKEGIWYRQPNYKNIKDFQQLNIIGNIIKLSNISDGLGEFVSDDYYSDVEIIDNHYNLGLQNKNKYSYKHNPSVHKLSDEIYNYNLETYGFYDFYGYCPMVDKELFNHKECHACQYLGGRYNARCIYRFKKILKENISEIYEIKYDRDGRVVSADLEINGERKKYSFDTLPGYTKTLLDFVKKYSGFKLARFVNVENGMKYQLSQNNMKYLITSKKCYGKLCEKYGKAKSFDSQIFNWDKPVWLLTWYVNDEDSKGTINLYKDNRVDNSDGIKETSICPICGGQVALIDNGTKVGCIKYPVCNYIYMDLQHSYPKND